MTTIGEERPTGRHISTTPDPPASSTTLPTLSERRTASRGPHMELRERVEEDGPKSPNVNPLFVSIPSPAGAAETALAALQYLPIPILVLSSLKTVIMANESMGRLLGLKLDGDNRSSVDAEGNQNESVTDVLRNQSLSQIGVDMLQEGQPIWVSWEIFLENLSDEMDRKKAQVCEEQYATPLDTIPSGESTPVAVPPIPPCKNSINVGDAHLPCRKRNMVHDAMVDVVLTSQYIEPPISSAKSNRSSSDHQVQARMIVSIWTLENQKYYTLTFTSSSHSTSTPPSRPLSRTITRPPAFTLSASSSPGSTYSSSQNSVICSSCGSSNSSAYTSPTSNPLSTPMFPPPGAPSRTNLASSPSVLQKITRMKDAILNTMKLPVFAMWNDESIALPNRAGRELLHQDIDPMTKDEYDLTSRCTLYTEDFSRKLEPEEYPIIQLCRTEKPFTSMKIGVKHPKTGKKTNFDVSGDGIIDEKTGEFLAGLVWFRDVTEYTDRIAIQNEQNEARFQTICDSLPQMLWTTTPDGSHDYFSARWYNYTGMTPEQSLGMGWQLPFHPDDMVETRKKWAHSLATGEPYSTEYRCQRHDGEWRWMLGRALPLKDHRTGNILKWFGSCTDVHDAVEARVAAKRTREQLMKVIIHAHVTLWAVDRDRKLTLLEGQYNWERSPDGDKFNEPTESAIGKDAYEVLGQGDPNVLRQLEPIDLILAGKSKEVTREFDVKGAWFRTRFIPVLGKKEANGVENQDYLDGVIGISVDISAMKTQATQLYVQEKENTRLLANEAAAKEASRLKSQFLANMSHEIRTPIAGVIGMADLLVDTTLNKDQQECAENIQRSANALLTVINDILDFSKIESGRLDIEEVQFSLSVVIRDVNKMLSFAAERKNLSFVCDAQVGLEHDLIVLGDPGRIRQIITNLLTNSIKFTSEGYVKLAVKTCKHTEDMVEVEFTVEDSGIGIDPEVRKRLFKPFSQADSSTARRFGGTGLGLTICKNLVDLMHGTIKLDSDIGRGTKAVFVIPFNKPQFHNGNSPLVDVNMLPDRLQSEMSVSCNSSDFDAIKHSTPPPQSPAEKIGISRNQPRPSPVSHNYVNSPSMLGSNYFADPEKSLPLEERGKFHILVVEDNAINQQIAIRTIKKLKFSVSAVWNGQEALQYLSEPFTHSHPRPSIILMDVQMPVIDGYRATHLLRHHQPYSTNPDLATIPIVAMTASAIQGDREKCRRAGMDDYLAKPVRGKTLERMLVKWVTEARRSSATPQFHNSEGSGSDGVEHHSSVCTEAGRPTMKSNVIDPTGDSAVNSETCSIGHGPLPAVSGSEQEVDHGMRRVDTEEKATHLRDDKLLAASDPMNPQVASLPNNNAPLQALTEENISKLVDQTKDQPSLGLSPQLEVRVSSPQDSTLSGVEGGRSNNATRKSSSSSQSVLGYLPAPNSRAQFAAGKMRRLESDQSADTITPMKHAKSDIDSGTT